MSVIKLRKIVFLAEVFDMVVVELLLYGSRDTYYVTLKVYENIVAG